MDLRRETLVPVSYIAGRFGTADGPEARLQLSAVELSVQEVTVPGAALTVSGNEYQSRSLDSHLWTDGRQALAFCGDLYNLGELQRLAADVVPRVRLTSVAHLFGNATGVLPSAVSGKGER